MTQTMKAIRIHQYGGPDVLTYEDAPRPDPGAGEVLVAVYAAGINPVDWKTRAGSGMARRYHDPFPHIPGWDISGVVEAVGPGASKFKPGDAVFGMVRFPEVGSAYAEYVAAPEQHLAHKPRNVDHLQAGAIPLVALTAWQALFEAGDLQSGQRLLIQGASGGVGHVAVQIAKAQGAYVIGTASTPNLDFLTSLGIDEAVDYTTTHVEDTIAPVDLLMNTVPGAIYEGSYPLVKAGGSLVSIVGGADPEKAAAQQIKADNILVHPEDSHLTHIAELMASGHLKVMIDQVFPLADAQKAHDYGERRSARAGKIVLQVRA